MFTCYHCKPPNWLVKYRSGNATPKFKKVAQCKCWGRNWFHRWTGKY